MEYGWKSLLLAGEYRYRKTKTAAEGVIPEETTTSIGYYGSAAYRFTDWFELGAYYSVNYPDEDDRNGDRFEALGQPDFRAWQKDFALTTRFDVADNWILKLEGHRINGVADLFALDNPDGFEEDWYLFAAKVTFGF